MVNVPFLELKKTIFNIFSTYGMNTKNAEQLADVLATADARGVYSHGVNLLFGYLQALREGWITANPKVRILRETEASLLIDGDRGFGGVVMPYVTDLAIQKAKKCGSCSVSVVNCGHYGAGAYYVNQAARANTVAFLYANGIKAAAPIGGKRAYLGTNPYSFSAPAGSYGLVTLDMATTETAASKLVVAANAGQSVKLGLGVDRNGKPCTDPKEILEHGSLSHFGGIKGYGISFMIHTMTGVLSHSAFKPEDLDLLGDKVGRPSVSFFLNVSDIESFNSTTQFKADMEEFIRDIKAVELAEGSSEIFFPGEIEQRNFEKAMQEGVGIREEIYARVLQEHKHCDTCGKGAESDG